MTYFQPGHSCIKGRKIRRILAGLETAGCSTGRGPEKVTFYEEGQTELNREARSVIADLGHHYGFGGFAIYRYGDSYLEGIGKWPAVNPDFPTTR